MQEAGCEQVLHARVGSFAAVARSRKRIRWLARLPSVASELPSHRNISIAALTATFLIVLATTGVCGAQTAPAPVSDDTEAAAAGRRPPRLGFVDGQVSFWRPGAEEWTAARLNTALAEGDQLYTGSPGNLEIQIGGRAYVRAWANTQLGLTNLEPDFVQLKVATGYVALDLRRLDPGQTVEVDTPNAAFTIERPAGAGGSGGAAGLVARYARSCSRRLFAS